MTVYYQTRRFIDLKGRLSILTTYLDNLLNLDTNSSKIIKPNKVDIK